MNPPFTMSKGTAHPASSHAVLKAPHGGELVQLMATAEKRNELMKESAGLPYLQISPTSAAYLAMLALGAFSPLDRFVGKRELESIWGTLRLTTGQLFPVPVLLPAGNLKHLDSGSRIALRDLQNRPLAVMTVEEIFEIPRGEQGRMQQLSVAGIHAGSDDRMAFSGPLQVFNIPADLLLPDMWGNPATIRERLSLLGRDCVVAVDDWDPRDSEQTARIRQLAEDRNASLMLNLAEAEPRLDAFGHYHRLLACKGVFSELFSPAQALLNFVHLEPTLRTERQILWHSIVHKNYGADIYVIDETRCRRLHSSIGNGSACSDPSPLLLECAAEIGIELIFHPSSRSASKSIFDLNQRSAKVPLGTDGLSSSPRHSGQETPSSDRSLYVPSEWGLCVWFTGLPCAGKSAIAEDLLLLLMESGLRVSLLDGDTVRTHLSKGLSFSKEDRDINVQRIGFVASEIVRHRGVVICAAVSPYRETRQRVREMMPEGSFVEVFVDTPIEECERRDVKGFYAKARAGNLSQFTGVNDPYELPLNAEVVLRTEHTTIRSNALELMQFLIDDQYLRPVSEFDEMRSHLKATGTSARPWR
jgi:sulfate adenylyltransferase